MGVAIPILHNRTGTIKGHSKLNIQLEEYLAVSMSLHLASRHQRTVSETSSSPREKTESAGGRSSTFVRQLENELCNYFIFNRSRRVAWV